MTNEVKIALTEVKKYHPEVCMVLFGQDGSWMFMDKDLGRPRFSDKIDVSIVGEACDSVNYFPAIFFAEDIRYDSLQYVREKRGLNFVVVDINYTPTPKAIGWVLELRTLCKEQNILFLSGVFIATPSPAITMDAL